MGLLELQELRDQQGQTVLLDLLVPLVLRVILEVQGPMEIKEIQDNLVLKDHRVLMVLMVSPELLVHQELLVL